MQHRSAAQSPNQGDAKARDAEADRSPTPMPKHPADQEDAVASAKASHGPQDANKYERIISVWTIVVGIFTGLLFVATGVSAYFLYSTDQAIHKTLLIGQRAFVHLERIDFAVTDNWVTYVETAPNITLWNAPKNMGKMIRSNFSLTNSGNTPAKSLLIMLHCELVGAGKKVDEPFNLMKWDGSKVVRRSIGAKQTIVLSVESCDFKNSDILLNAQMGIVPVFLVGFLTYEDWIEPGKQHRTQFAHRLIVNDYGRDNKFTGMSVSTEPLGTHNCTDEDCPK